MWCWLFWLTVWFGVSFVIARVIASSIRTDDEEEMWEWE